MLRYRKMWISLGVLSTLSVLWFLVLSRRINPDRYFVRALEPIPFSRIYVNDYVGSLQLTPDIGDEYRVAATGKRNFISNTYSLYDDEYSFTIDNDNNFVLKQRSNNQTFILGKVVEKKNLEYNGTDLYTIQIPKEYTNIHQYRSGRLPYYEKVSFTMMNSGGIKYSSETTTVVKSPSDRVLRLYRNNGYIPKVQPTGIY